MQTTFATKTAFFVAAEGAGGIEFVERVRPDHARAQFVYHFEDLAAFIGPDAGAEPVRRVIGALHGFFRCAECHHGEDRPEDLFLRKATVEYLGSARYDDTLTVLCRTASLGRTSMTMRFEIWREGDSISETPLVTAELVYVNVRLESSQPDPLPDDLRGLVRAYERVPV